MYDEYDMEDLLPGKKKSKHTDLLSELRSMEEDEYQSPSGLNAASFLPSSMLKETKKEKKKETEQYWNGYDPDNWFNEMMGYQGGKINKNRGKIKNDLFESAGIYGKKKKKKKKEKGDLTDYKREFEPEMALYKNLLMDQNRFTESLQKEYDAIKSVKSSSRGVTKQMTDLIENITDARSLAMQLVEKNVNAKKLIAELTLKQKKELGGNLDGENMADFASTYLKQMLTDRNAVINGTGDATVSEYSEDELFTELSNSLVSGNDDERPEEVEKYLKYENSNVEVFVSIRDNDVENYEFIAQDAEGNVLDDYPMPNHTSISVNRSTNVATDTFGKKYPILWS